MSKSKSRGSSLSDAVVAALAKVEGDSASEGEDVAASEAGCAATQQAGNKPPPIVAPSRTSSAPSGPTNGKSNLFRQGPGSFRDLMQRWAGGAPMPAAQPTGAQPPVGAQAGVETERVSAPEPAPRTSSVPPPARVDEGVSEEPEAAETTAVNKTAAPIEVRYFGRTDVGLVREHNEDNFLVADLEADIRNGSEPRAALVPPEGLVFAVCDGMGGAAAGEVASQMAVDTVHEVMAHGGAAKDRDEFAHRLVRAIEEAGHRIFSAAKMDRTRRGMGTTSTLAGLIDNMLFVGQVGDSRAYILRGDQLGMVTKDQSLVNQLIEAGQLTEEEAEAFEHSNIILQALGTTEDVTVDLTFLELRKGDRLMMCSDGLSGLVHAEMIKEVLQTEKDLEAAATKLIQMANAGGGHDNITVIVADFDGEGLTEPGEAQVAYQQYPLPPDETKRGKSLPPRDMSIKAGARKPGADVKSAAAFVGDEEIAAPADRGGKMMIVIAVAALLGVLAVAAWYLASSGSDPSEHEPDPEVPTTVTDPIEEEVIEEPIPDGPDMVEGEVTITTDVENGHLYINGQLYESFASGESIILDEGGYTFEIREGETSVAQEVVTVRADETQTVELNRPAGADPESVEETPEPTPQVRHPRPPRPPRPLPPRPRPLGGGSPSGGGAVPSNPF